MGERPPPSKPWRVDVEGSGGAHGAHYRHRRAAYADIQVLLEFGYSVKVWTWSEGVWRPYERVEPGS